MSSLLKAGPPSQRNLRSLSLGGPGESAGPPASEFVTKRRQGRARRPATPALRGYNGHPTPPGRRDEASHGTSQARKHKRPRHCGPDGLATRSLGTAWYWHSLAARPDAPPPETSRQKVIGSLQLWSRVYQLRSSAGVAGRQPGPPARTFSSRSYPRAAPEWQGAKDSGEPLQRARALPGVTPAMQGYKGHPTPPGRRDEATAEILVLRWAGSSSRGLQRWQGAGVWESCLA